MNTTDYCHGGWESNLYVMVQLSETRYVHCCIWDLLERALSPMPNSILLVNVGLRT